MLYSYIRVNVLMLHAYHAWHFSMDGIQIGELAEIYSFHIKSNLRDLYDRGNLISFEIQNCIFYNENHSGHTCTLWIN